jgi:hypothetical protein
MILLCLLMLTFCLGKWWSDVVTHSQASECEVYATDLMVGLLCQSELFTLYNIQTQQSLYHNSEVSEIQKTLDHGIQFTQNQQVIHFTSSFEMQIIA